MWCILLASPALWAQPEIAKSPVAAAAPHNASSEAPTPAFISGIVLDRATGSPLRKAQVNLSTDETVPLDAQAITDIDVTAAEVLNNLNQELRQRGIALKIAHANRPLREILERIGLTHEIGQDSFFSSVHECVDAFQRT